MPDTIAPVITRERGYATPSGYIDGYVLDSDEQTPDLTFPTSIAVYDRMRRSDGQIAAVLRAVRLSVARLAWHIDPSGAENEITEFVANNLSLPILGREGQVPLKRVRDRFSFQEHLRMAMLALVFGFIPFEVVYRITESEGGPRAEIRKLAPRMPTTIVKINVDRYGRLESVEQNPRPFQPQDRRRNEPYGNIILPVERLVMYCHEREGGVWTGRSVLRPIYAHWLLKERLLRVDTASAERNGMGVPWITAPEGATQDDVQRYADLAATIRVGEEAGGAGPAGSKLQLVGVSGQLPDVLARIKYHDEQIAQSLFAQFLHLGGTSGSGSRALGESFVEFFLMSIDAIATEFISTFNAHVIEDLVDVNFGPDEYAPKLVASPARERRSITAAELVALSHAGLIKPTSELLAYVTDRYGLPEGTGEELVLPETRSTTAPVNLPGGSEAEEPEPSDGVDDE